VASAAPLSLGGGKLCLRGKRLFTELASVGSRQGGQGARGYMGERPPGRLVPRPTGCGYPHVRLVMHVRNYARHATARPNMAASRRVVRLTSSSTSAPSRGERGRGGGHAAPGLRRHIPSKECVIPTPLYLSKRRGLPQCTTRRYAEFIPFLGLRHQDPTLVLYRSTLTSRQLDETLHAGHPAPSSVAW
jgi:hypothetical protein